MHFSLHDEDDGKKFLSENVHCTRDPGRSASDKPFSSARVISGEQRLRGGFASIHFERERDSAIRGMLGEECDTMVKVN